MFAPGSRVEFNEPAEHGVRRRTGVVLGHPEHNGVVAKKLFKVKRDQVASLPSGVVVVDTTGLVVLPEKKDGGGTVSLAVV